MNNPIRMDVRAWRIIALIWLARSVACSPLDGGDINPKPEPPQAADEQWEPCSDDPCDPGGQPALAWCGSSGPSRG
jgi:hypothetical protein